MRFENGLPGGFGRREVALLLEGEGLVALLGSGGWGLGEAERSGSGEEEGQQDFWREADHALLHWGIVAQQES
jgi:hypothetical protein